MSSPKISSLIPVILVLAWPVALPAKSNEKIAATQLQAQLKGKVVIFRHIYSDNALIFDDQLKLVKGGTPGRWTLDGLVEIQKVSLKGENYVIEGRRILQKYNRQKKELGSYRSAQKITMELPTSSADGHPVDLAMFVQNFFLKPGELYPEDLPAYWKPYLTCVRERHPDCDDPNKDRNTEGYPPKLEPEKGMTYPQVKHRAEPEYTDIAREAKLEGLIIFLAAVDKEGNLRLLEIIRPLGLGMDESAAEKLSQWKFSPATRDGQTIDVRMSIEMYFSVR